MNSLWIHLPLLNNIYQGDSIAYNFPSSLALEFDFYDNDFDPNGNHVVFHSSKSPSANNGPQETFAVSGYATPATELCPSGGYVVLVLCSANYDFEVSIDGNLELSANVNIPDTYAMDSSGESWIGMTGASGGTFATKEIVDFAFYEYDFDPASTVVTT